MEDILDCKNRYYGPNRYFYEDNHAIIKAPREEYVEYSDPESEYMDERKLKRATNSLRWRPYIKSFIVSRYNKVVWEKYMHGGGKDQCDNIHSVSKSVLSALTGIAINEGLLTIDAKVSEILPEMFNADTLAKNITIENLLTMTTGLDWIEDNTEYIIDGKRDWVKGILNRPMLEDPGEFYNYSSGASHVLSAVIQKVSGMSTCRYAHRHIFNPLNINVAQWSWDPEGIFCGGFNVYMSPLDLMKFSLIFLNNGTFAGKEIVPQSWVKQSTMPMLDVEGISYGYYWWIDEIRGYKVYFAWGYGGQFVYVIPDLKITVVITSDTRFFQSSYDARSLIRRYITTSLI